MGYKVVASVVKIRRGEGERSGIAKGNRGGEKFSEGRLLFSKAISMKNEKEHR